MGQGWGKGWGKRGFGYSGPWLGMGGVWVCAIWKYGMIFSFVFKIRNDLFSIFHIRNYPFYSGSSLSLYFVFDISR